MLAMQKIAPQAGGMAVCDREVPIPGPGQMLLKLEAAGICGSPSWCRTRGVLTLFWPAKPDSLSVE